MSERPCVLCSNAIDDVLQLGEKTTYEDTTAHLYCLLLTSNLVQHGEDNEGICGFMPKDIKAEVSRTKKLLCCYCHQKSATIGCCVKACRRSFHLPCALQNDCQFEFTNTFRSFCEDHRTIKKPKHIHQPTDLCTICYDEMGKYNLIKSIPLPCCNKNAWCHKMCLQTYAQTSGYFLKCPLCNDSDNFREWIAQRGVFIPDRDAKWEVDETGPNTFYGFEQHNERPSKCVAKVCKCSKGRSYQVDSENSRYSLVCCHYCGSHAVHLVCLDAAEFRCDDCEAVLSRKQENAASSSTTSVSSSTVARNGSMRRSRGGNARASYSGENRTNERVGKYLLPQILINKFKLRDCSVRLTRLTPKDFALKSDSTDSEYDTADTKGRRNTSHTSGHSSDEKEIKPVIRKSQTLASISESDTDSDIEVVRVKTASAKKKNPFSDSESDRKSLKMDCNENSRYTITSNQAFGTPELKNPFEYLMKSTSNGLRASQFSSSEEETIRPSGTNSLIRKILCTDSSDDQKVGKENEKPAKSVAVVRPFSMPETSSDESVKGPVNVQRRPIILSSDETTDESHKTSITQRFDYLKNAGKKQEKFNVKINDASKTPDRTVKTEPTRLTPTKRKHRSVRSFFRDISSSDDEMMEPKPKRKSPKKSRKNSPSNYERPPNQSTIMNFFKKQFNQSI